MQLILSNVRPGQVPQPADYDWNTKTAIPLDGKQIFRDSLDETQRVNQLVRRSLVFVQDSLTVEAQPTEIYFSNYLGYLEKCWAAHAGIVITPDILWYTLLCELAIVVKGSPENYRPLFSGQAEKHKITVMAAPPVLPLEAVVAEMDRVLPVNSADFLPQFSTSTIRSQQTMRAAFCDLCSPYCNYSMYLCGIPFIDVQGTEQDWQQLRERWQGLIQLVSRLDAQPGVWMYRVMSILDQLVSRWQEPVFWREMFWLEKCGSGHQTEVRGWFAQLFWVVPDVAYASNFSTHVSRVSYRDLSGNTDYVLKAGLFCGRPEGEFLVPDFGYLVYQQLPETLEIPIPSSVRYGDVSAFVSRVTKELLERTKPSVGA
jgi:hypothetical protein